MWIKLGRLLMLCIWGFLVFNLLYPFPGPIKYFINLALIFMVIMHGLQLILLRATQTRQNEKLSRATEIKFFIFGVFELLAWQKKMSVKSGMDDNQTS